MLLLPEKDDKIVILFCCYFAATLPLLFYFSVYYDFYFFETIIRHNNFLIFIKINLPLLCRYFFYRHTKSSKNTQKFTVIKFLTIFRNCDWYGKDVIFLHFFEHVFSKFAKMDILKMSKKRFPKHFCMFIF